MQPEEIEAQKFNVYTSDNGEQADRDTRLAQKRTFSNREYENSTPTKQWLQSLIDQIRQIQDQHFQKEVKACRL